MTTLRRGTRPLSEVASLTPGETSSVQSLPLEGYQAQHIFDMDWPWEGSDSEPPHAVPFLASSAALCPQIQSPLFYRTRIRHRSTPAPGL